VQIRITVPGRPTRWMRPGQGIDGEGNAVRYTDPKARAGKAVIAQEARLVYRATRPHLGPVVLCVVAVFAIPKSWPPALRQAAIDGKVWHTSDPDLDQLVKQVQDALVGIAYIDDNQVVGYHPNTAKRYGHPERTDIEVFPLNPVDAAKPPAQRRLEKKLGEEGWDALLAPPAHRGNRSKAGSDPLRARRFRRRAAGR
jgi:Holliday junction resolvase RusA-like endonuclease